MKERQIDELKDRKTERQKQMMIHIGCVSFTKPAHDWVAIMVRSYMATQIHKVFKMDRHKDRQIERQKETDDDIVC